MFGCAKKIGLGDSSLLKETYASINSEEDLAEILNIESTQRAENDENILDDEAMENQDDVLEIDVHCIICGQESSKAHRCYVCDFYVHFTCGESTEEDEGYGNQVKCNLCFRKERINEQHEKAQLGLTKQAEKIIFLSNSKLPPLKIGSSVVVRVADVGRGRTAARNVLAVILNVNSDRLYQLGTKGGTLERLYARNEFTPADSNFIGIQEVPSNRLSLRTTSTASSGSKKGFIFCNCRRYCIDKKCKCRSNYVKCNSKCHSNSSCKNK